MKPLWDKPTLEQEQVAMRERWSSSLYIRRWGGFKPPKKRKKKRQVKQVNRYAVPSREEVIQGILGY